MPPSRESPVYQLIRSNHEQAEAGHKRLRGDWREHDERLESLEASRQACEARFIGIDAALTAIKTTPPELAKLSLTPGIVAAIIITAGGIIASNVASTWGMRSDIRDISTRMNAQDDAARTREKLQEERAQAQRNATEAIGKKQELLQLKFEELRDQVLGRRSR